MFPNGREDVIAASSNDTVNDVIRRACVAESLNAPVSEVKASIGGVPVSGETAVSELPSGVPLALAMPPQYAATVPAVSC